MPLEAAAGEERRVEYGDLVRKVDSLASDMTHHIKEHPTLEQKIDSVIAEIVGVRQQDPLTGEITYTGGMKQDITYLKRAAENGGFTTKWSAKQKWYVSVIVPVVTALLVALVQTNFGS
jgi:hypothetical protein